MYGQHRTAATRSGQGGSARCRFVVTAIDKSGNRARNSPLHRLEYVNPLREVSGLTPRRIDLGVDYAGHRAAAGARHGAGNAGQRHGLGSAELLGDQLLARRRDRRLPAPGRSLRRQVRICGRAHHCQRQRRTNREGRTADRHALPGIPMVRMGLGGWTWPRVAGDGGRTQVPVQRSRDWSTIDGRNMNPLLVSLGAPSGLLQANPPNQSMPSGWPSWSG